MTEDAKMEIQAALGLLKAALVANGVSMAVNQNSGELYFFDTVEYLTNQKYSGFKTNIKELVGIGGDD